jgi:hypothetical protein
MTIAVEVMVVIIGAALLVGWIAATLMRRQDDDDAALIKPKRSSPSARRDLTSELERLFSLYQAGGLTSEEYQALKEQLLSGQPVNTTPADLQARVENLLQENRKIEAIKLYREETNLGLKEAKDAVDEIERKMRLM